MTRIGPIVFDRIAHAYDDQRAHPAEVSAQIGAAIAGVAGPGARVLELGIGTGRIAAPSQAAGCRVVGIDIADGMLRVAQAKGIGQLIRGNIAQLPFQAGAFDAVLAVHVLHHLTDWRSGLAEAARLLRPGGALIQGRDWQSPDSCAGRIRGKLREIVMELRPTLRPPGAGAAVAQALTKLGGEPAAEQVAASWHEPTSPAAVIATIARRDDAESWVFDDELLAAALERLYEWAGGVWPSLDAPEQIERRFILQVTRFPAGLVG